MQITMNSITKAVIFGISLAAISTGLLAARPSELRANPDPVRVGRVITLSAKVGPRERVQFAVKGRPIGQVTADAAGTVRAQYYVQGNEFPMRQGGGTINWSVNNLSDRNYQAGSSFTALR